MVMIGQIGNEKKAGEAKCQRHAQAVGPDPLAPDHCVAQDQKEGTGSIKSSIKGRKGRKGDQDPGLDRATPHQWAASEWWAVGGE